jgi:hypothetical protein
MCICEFSALGRCRCRCRCTLSRSKTALTKVPPVGFEPTPRTLLGGRPLPLGYGGALIITRFCYLSSSTDFLCRRQKDGDLYIAGYCPRYAAIARKAPGRGPPNPQAEHHPEGGPRAASPGKPDSAARRRRQPNGRATTANWPCGGRRLATMLWCASEERERYLRGQYRPTGRISHRIQQVSAGTTPKRVSFCFPLYPASRL